MPLATNLASFPLQVLGSLLPPRRCLWSSRFCLTLPADSNSKLDAKSQQCCSDCVSLSSLAKRSSRDLQTCSFPYPLLDSLPRRCININTRHGQFASSQHAATLSFAVGPRLSPNAPDLIGAVQISKLHRSVRARAQNPVTIEDVAALQSCSVYPVRGGPPCSTSSLIAPDPALTLLVFFTHWADLGSAEFAQRLVDKRAEIEATGVRMVGVGLGSAPSGAEFAARTKFPAESLYADPQSACYKALQFSAGALPDSDVNGYAKALLMLAGIGSPGTMQEVVRGYIGDREAKPIFSEGSFWGSAFGTVGSGYQRPFELATLRLQNMVGSLSNWSKLAPEDSQQLVQQGGCLLLRGEQILFTHKDSGILMTTDVEALLAALKAAAAAPARVQA